jgi:hypothetical protein
MTQPYAYDVRDCDVLDREGLNSFRQKRAQWSSWLDDDPDHAIWDTVAALVWRDTTFATVSKLALENPAGPLTATLLGETIVSGHVAMQVLALRRLIDRGSDIISLRRLITDLRRNWHLLTRENFVCFDGLPYDYVAVMREVWAERGPGVHWGETSGPKAYGTSDLLHRQFDRLSGVDAAKRKRSDALPKSLLAKVEGWLQGSEAEEIVKWSHSYLAHAGNSQDREAIAHIQMTNNKISAAIRDVARVTEALAGEILYIGGRANALMPVAQYDVFERLEKPIAQDREREAAAEVWRTKSDEWDAALQDVRDALCIDA